MLPLPPVPPEMGWRQSIRLPRDHYVRIDCNDYSVHPGVIGRRIEVHADLDRVWVRCEGAIVADHQRVWAQHQTITDFDHAVAAKLLRRGRADLLRRPGPRHWHWRTDRNERVEIRSLGSYDTLVGSVDAVDDAVVRRCRDGCPQPDDPDRRLTGRDVTTELAYLTRALKAPTLRESVERLAERAREESLDSSGVPGRLPAT